MDKKAFKYIGLCMGVYLGMTIIEALICNLVLGLITDTYWIYLIVYGVILLIINPIATYLIVDMIDPGFKKQSATEAKKAE